MREVACLIAEALSNLGSEERLGAVRQRVAALADRFPLYAWKSNAVATG
jgi:glycine/serine hydroxymethyltransferase